MKPVETVSVYPAIASIIEETINLLQGEENPYPYKRWNTLRKKIHINKSAQLMDRAITKASMTTYGKFIGDITEIHRKHDGKYYGYTKTDRWENCGKQHTDTTLNQQK